MSFKKVIESWVEEGFSRFRGSLDDQLKFEGNLIPDVTDSDGRRLTPRPLFPEFFESKEMKLPFLAEFFETIEEGLHLAKDKRQESGSKRTELEATNFEEGFEKTMIEHVPIEYHRKNIFLSRFIESLFEIPDSIVYRNSPQYDTVVVRNNLYSKAVHLYRSDEAVLTNESCEAGCVIRVDQSAETDPLDRRDQSQVVNSYEMAEHYGRREMETTHRPKSFQDFLNARTKFRNYEEFLSKIQNFPETNESIMRNLYVLEKTLNYNSYRDTLLSYHQVLPPDKPTPEEQLVEHLTFHLPSMADEYSASCLDCHPHSPHLFVVGYGVTRTQDWNREDTGMVVCWNIHKPAHPERVYPTSEPVLCVGFSRLHPSRIGTGMKHGRIRILSVLREGEEWVRSHPPFTGDVVALRWVERETALPGEPQEVLVTLSSDGLMVTWNADLEGQILRTVKRGDLKRRPLLAPDAPPTCIDHDPRDPNVFLVGTMEGEVLQGLVDSPDEYSAVYSAHGGPLSGLQWSPLVEGVFFTCGSDQAAHIWQVGRARPCKSLHLPEPLLGLSPSRTKSTVLATLTRHRLALFDLDRHLNRPVAMTTTAGSSYELPMTTTDDVGWTVVTFCPGGDWLLAGQTDGRVRMYRLIGVPPLDDGVSQSEALLAKFMPNY